MGIEKIKEEILEKAASAEKEILAEASKKVDEIKKDSSEKIKAVQQEFNHRLSIEKKQIESKEVSLANLESQKLEFETKKEILDKVYKEAFDKIKRMSKKDRSPLIKSLLDKASKEIDVAAVYVNDIDKEFVDESASLDTEGGVICETKDGNVRIDYTFKTLFEDLKEKTIKEVSKLLF